MEKKFTGQDLMDWFNNQPTSLNQLLLTINRTIDPKGTPRSRMLNNKRRVYGKDIVYKIRKVNDL